MLLLFGLLLFGGFSSFGLREFGGGVLALGFSYFFGFGGGKFGFGLVGLGVFGHVLDFIIKSKTESHFKIPGRFIEMGQFIAEKGWETWLVVINCFED